MAQDLTPLLDQTVVRETGHDLSRGIRMLNERGFSLVEALTAATISVIAVMGLAYSFGVGRGLVDRYEVARAALGEAQSQLEALTLLPVSDTSLRLGYVAPLSPSRNGGLTH